MNDVVVIEENTIGTTHYRLVEEDGRQRIELWSSVSIGWRRFGRGNVQQRWEDLKQFNEKVRQRIAERKEQVPTKSVRKRTNKHKKPLGS